MQPLTPIELRHTLHRNPEIAFQEFKTTSLLIQNIKNLPGSNRVIVHTPMETGLLVEYKVNDDSYLLFRADIDALPIREENEIKFKSTNNFMHACGHDVHTSILYSFLSEVLQQSIGRNLLFFFQPAEEAGGGAIKFYEKGIFEKFKIANAFALHVTDEYPAGTVASKPGVLFASALEIDIEFIGESAHVAFPLEGKNAFNALRKFLDKAETIRKDYEGLILMGLGKFSAGTVRNISPGFAKIEGSIRGLNSKLISEFYDKMESLLHDIFTESSVGYRIVKGAAYPEVIVDENLFKKIKPILSDKFYFTEIETKFTGEDFGFLSQKWPSFMFWLGTSKGERYGLHNPKFLPPDEIIEKGKEIFKEILKNF